MAKSRQTRHRPSSPTQQNSTLPSPSSSHELQNESHNKSIVMGSLLATPQPLRLLIISLGNPGSAYQNTLHSAGHTLISALVASLSLPSLRLGSLCKAPGDEFTLYQSPTFMNDSGPAVAKVWRQFQRSCREKGEECKLVVLHDELELPIGSVSVKDGNASPRGHNGLKSVKEVLGERARWTRIGVGIGRPESRAPDVVASWVLRKMSSQERRGIEGCVERVEVELRRIAERDSQVKC